MAVFSEFTDKYIETFCDDIYDSQIKPINKYNIYAFLIFFIFAIISILIFIFFREQILSYRKWSEHIITLCIVPILVSYYFRLFYSDNKIKKSLYNVLINNIREFVSYAPKMDLYRFLKYNSIVNFCKFSSVCSSFQATYDDISLSYSFYLIYLKDRQRIQENSKHAEEKTVFRGVLYKFNNLNNINYKIDSVICPKMKLKATYLDSQEGSLYALVQTDLYLPEATSLSKKEVIKFFKKQVKFFSQIVECAKNMVTYECDDNSNI